jgi:hypothetical protein
MTIPAAFGPSLSGGGGAEAAGVNKPGLCPGNPAGVNAIFAGGVFETGCGPPGF